MWVFTVEFTVNSVCCGINAIDVNRFACAVCVVRSMCIGVAGYRGGLREQEHVFTVCMCVCVCVCVCACVCVCVCVCQCVCVYVFMWRPVSRAYLCYTLCVMHSAVNQCLSQCPCVCVCWRACMRPACVTTRQPRRDKLGTGPWLRSETKKELI